MDGGERGGEFVVSSVFFGARSGPAGRAGSSDDSCAHLAEKYEEREDEEEDVQDDGPRDVGDQAPHELLGGLVHLAGRGVGPVELVQLLRHHDAADEEEEGQEGVKYPAPPEGLAVGPPAADLGEESHGDRMDCYGRRRAKESVINRAWFHYSVSAIFE